MAPLNLQALLKAMLDKGASDLHITAGSPPRLRIDNALVRLQTDALTPVDCKTLCYSVMNVAQKVRFVPHPPLNYPPAPPPPAPLPPPPSHPPPSLPRPAPPPTRPHHPPTPPPPPPP